MPGPRRAFAAMLLAVLACAGAAPALTAEQRIALVIGNSAYADSPLTNPVNDARLMGGALRAQGFEVIERLDVGRVAMQRAVKEFGNRLKASQGQAIGLFYYAGHGVQVRGENFLIPIDAEIEDEGDVDIYGISANAVLRTIEDARNGLNIVVLDACRNNPYERGFRDASRGLALMEAPTGTLIAYSTAPGQVAIDGSGANSPYTEALARALAMPGVPVEQMFKSVRNDVLAATQGRQTPWEASSLTGVDFYLVAAPAAVVEPQPMPVPAPVFDHAAMELAFWQSIQDSDDPRRFQAYLDQYPGGAFAAIARLHLDELSETEAAVVTPPPPPPEAEVAAIAVVPPPAIWDGIWIGEVRSLQGVDCQYVVGTATKISLQVRGGKITGEAIGRGNTKVIIEIKGDVLSDNTWRAMGNGTLDWGPRTVLWFSGNFATGVGTWRDTVNDCRGEMTLSRDE